MRRESFLEKHKMVIKSWMFDCTSILKPRDIAVTIIVIFGVAGCNDLT